MNGLSAFLKITGALASITLAIAAVRIAIGRQPELTEDELDEIDPYRDADVW